MSNKFLKFLGVAVVTSMLSLGISNTTVAGPVIVGGDDLQDHGFFSAGVNQEGWKYIELAITDLFTNQTRAADSGAATTVDVAALGSAFSTATSSNGGGAIRSAVAATGGASTVSYHDGAAAINQFFTDLAAGTINPAVIWLAGTGTSNVLDSAEGAALVANAAALNTYVANGGGLMSHGTGTVGLGWLSTLLPGINITGGCSSSGATLTAAGQAAFPGLTNADVDANAGPCHNSFSGDFGGLVSLVNDGQGRPYIIGGGTGTIIVCGQPGQPECPTGVSTPATLPLLGLGLIGLASVLRRKASAGSPLTSQE